MKTVQTVLLTNEDLLMMFKAHVQAACFYVERIDFKSYIDEEVGILNVIVSHGRCGNPQFLFPGSMIAVADNGALEIYMSAAAMRNYISKAS